MKSAGKKAKAVSIVWTLVGIGSLGLWIWYRVARGELSGLGATLFNLDRRWFEGALALQAAFVFWQAVLYRCLYQMQGYSIPIRRLYLLILISTCAGRLVPLGAAASLFALAATARREGVPEVVTVAVSCLYYLLSYGTFSLFIVFSLMYIRLTRAAGPRSHYPLAAVLFLLLAGLLGLGFLLRKPGRLEEVVRRICGIVNQASIRLRRKALVDGEALAQRCTAIVSNFAKILSKPRVMWIAFLSAFLLTVTNILTLYSVFRSLGGRPPLGLVVSGYTLGTVISFLTFVPNGVGVYVVSLWSVFTLMGTPSIDAGTVSIVYRFTTYWVPALAGLGAWVIYRNRKPREEGTR